MLIISWFKKKIRTLIKEKNTAFNRYHNNILLYYKNCFVTDVKEKPELFNCFFSEQCSLLANHSELPTGLSFRTNKRLSSITFSAEYIGKIIQGLDDNKAHGHDKISIRMLKICGDTICKPLGMIFRQVFTSSSFPSEWKKVISLRFIKKWQTKTIVQSLCFLFLAKFLKDLFLTKYLGFFWKRNFLYLTGWFMHKSNVINYQRNV